MEQLMTTKYLDSDFYKEIKKILITARHKSYQAANFAMVQAYWEIGKSIVEKQGGNERSEYGRGLIKELSQQMTKDFGKGFDERNLRHMRLFYQSYPIWNAVRTELSWTHYRLLIKIKNERARQFYTAECIKANWSTRQLERQINSFYYERLLSSKDKESVAKEIFQLDPTPKKPEDIIRDPYVLEFLGFKQEASFYESDLEEALIDHIQSFLIELGTGFSFVARQKRITLDGDHFFIDLVFYHYVLKCFVLIDLKTTKLTHQDIGQMQMYVNYYTREFMNEGDQKTIGIILCASKNDSVVKYTLDKDNEQVFASKYQLCLPSEKELEEELSAKYLSLSNHNV